MGYVSKEQIERAKQLDLLTYLQMFEPAELVRCSRNVYSTRTHDSLKISNGKWCWWSRGIGGRSALDYLIKVRGLSFPEAVLQIDGHGGDFPSVSISAELTTNPKRLMLPEPNDTNRHVIAYLTQRGIHRSIIDFCLETGRLYESRFYHNAVFVGFDPQGVPRYAMLRGIAGQRYMGEAMGSDKRYAFSVPAQEEGSELHLFESAIDLLSFGTLERLSNRDWRKEHLLSLAGIYKPKANVEKSALPAALMQYLQRYPQMKRLVLHLDNDQPGRLAAQTFQTLLSPTLIVSDEPPQRGKDVNDELRWKLRRIDRTSR